VGNECEARAAIAGECLIGDYERSHEPSKSRNAGGAQQPELPGLSQVSGGEREVGCGAKPPGQRQPELLCAGERSARMTRNVSVSIAQR